MKSIFCHKAKAVPPAANTLRFEFGNQSYNPVTAGVGSSGTWKRCEFMPGNVWDWTNTNTNWATAFGGGNTTTPGAFADYENNPVKVIAAGDTSSVTDFSRFFQNCYAITEVCPIDTSEASTVFLMFSHCEHCSKFSDVDFSSATDTRGVYQCCYEMTSGPNIILPTDHAYSLQNFFLGCKNLETVPLYNLEQCTNTAAMFQNYAEVVGSYMSLKSVPEFDTSNVTDMHAMFCYCKNLQSIPLLDTSNVTNMHNMFSGCESLTEIPSLDYSKVTRFENFVMNCASLTEIPEMNIEANVTRCDNMFNNCPNIKSGQKALYDTLSAINTINNHTNCFKDCGSDTEEGRAELAQIPVSWGGTMPEL